MMSQHLAGTIPNTPFHVVADVQEPLEPFNCVTRSANPAFAISNLQP